VRSPLDRAVSSYIHVMGKSSFSRSFAELDGACDDAAVQQPAGTSDVHHCARNATFSQWVRALDARALSQRASFGDGHFMPQYSPALSMPGVLLIPIEALPDLYSCPPVDRLRGWQLPQVEPADAEIFVGHYKQHAADSPANSEHWSFARIHQAVLAHQTPPYHSFYRDKGFCHHVIGCLYKQDVEMYARACSQPLWQENEGVESTQVASCRQRFRAVCEAQLARFRACGLNV
jgi:hypothetical protein